MKEFNTVEDIILENITVVDAAIENHLSNDISSDAIVYWGYNIGIIKGINIEDEQILIKILIDITVQNKEHQKLDITGQFTINAIFQVKSLIEYINKIDDDSIHEMDASLASILLSTAYSTARGIIYTRCLGTILGNVILPIVSVKQLLDISDNKLLKENTEI